MKELKTILRIDERIQKFEALSLREKLTLVICLCLIIWYGMDLLLVAPALQKEKSLRAVAASQQQELKRVSLELDAVRHGQYASGDPALLQKIRDIESELKKIDSGLRASHEHMVPPERIGALLQDLLRYDGQLELVSLSSLPVTGIAETAAPASAGQDKGSTPTLSDLAALAERKLSTAAETVAVPDVYRHGVELTVRGDYLDVMRYLERVESLPWRMYWGRFHMDAPDNGKPTFRIALYTLSFDKSWLKI